MSKSITLENKKKKARVVRTHVDVEFLEELLLTKHKRDRAAFDDFSTAVASYEH